MDITIMKKFVVVKLNKYEIEFKGIYFFILYS